MIWTRISARAGLAALAAAALAGCSGGSSAPGATGWTSTWMFYRDSTPGGLVALDPVTLATATVEPSDAATVVHLGFARAGTWNPSLGLVDNAHVGAILYVKQDGAAGEFRLYAVDAASTASPTPRRLSTLAVRRVCGWAFFADHASPESSAALLWDPGPDGSCATEADNPVTQVRMSASPTSAPATYAGGSGVESVYPVASTSGGIQAWLVKRPGVPGVWVEPSDWATLASTTLTPSSSIAFVTSTPGKVLLSVDGGLKVYTAGGSALTDPGNVPTTFPATRAVAQDGRDLYFVEANVVGATVRRVRLDGSAAVEDVRALGADSARALLLSEDRVAYRSQTGAWKAFPKAGGTAVTLFTPQASNDSVTALAVGRSFYFDATTATTMMSASIDPSGAVSLHAAPGRSYYFMPIPGRTKPFDPGRGLGTPSRMVLVESDRVNGGATLHTYDAATAAQLGAVPFPPEYAASTVGLPTVGWEGSGGSGCTLVTGTRADRSTALFAWDVAQQGPLRRVTARSDVAPVVDFNCSTAGGLGVPAVLALAAARLVRRRRG